MQRGQELGAPKLISQYGGTAITPRLVSYTLSEAINLTGLPKSTISTLSRHAITAAEKENKDLLLDAILNLKPHTGCPSKFSSKQGPTKH